MPVGTAPRNTANFTVEYSTDGTSYTAFTGVISAIPDAETRKVIERMLAGATRVQKYVGRANHGNIKITLEYGSALFTTFSAFSTTTLYYVRVTADDTGGTNGHRFIYSGYWSEFQRPELNGDDKTAEMALTLAVDNVTYTGAA